MDVIGKLNDLTNGNLLLWKVILTTIVIALAGLQVAMAANDFYGLRIEWWHFVTKQWKNFVPAEEIEKVKRNGGATGDVERLRRGN